MKHSPARWLAVLLVTLIAVYRPIMAGGAEEEQDIAAMIAAAKTKQDHENIAAYYDQEARGLLSKAEQHQNMAKTYGALESSAGKGPKLAEHCRSLAEKYQAAAEENLKMKALHHDMAGQVQ